MRPLSPPIGRRAVLRAAAFAATLGPAAAADADTARLVIGTGAVTGHYFAVGGAIARIASAASAQDGPRLGVEATNGAAENLIRVAAGDLDLGLAPSDMVHAAYHGFGQFEGERRLPALRTLASLQREPLIVLARADTGATALDDLRGLRLNVGVPGTAMHALVTSVLDAFAWGGDDLAHVALRPIRSQLDDLCAGRVDAIAFTAASPSGSVARSLSACATVAVDIAGEPIDRLLAERPYLTPAVIPAADYPQLDRDVRSVGPVTTLVASDSLAAADAARIVASLADNVGLLAAMHPALAGLTLDALLSDRLAAPLHDGARRYLEGSGRL